MVKKPLKSEFKFGSAATAPRYARGIILGDSGSGKTTLGATAPKPLLVVNIDRGIASLPRDPNIFIYPDPAEGRPVKSWTELKDFISFCENGGLDDIETIMFDSITEAGELLKEHILGQAGPTKRVHNRVLSQADYGLFGTFMLDLIRRIVELPANVVLTAQPRDDMVDKPEGGKVVWRMPDFGHGQMTAPKAIPLMDFQGVLEVEVKDKQLVRKLILQPINNRKGKIRTKPGVTAPVSIDRPDLMEVFKLIAGDEKGE